MMRAILQERVRKIREIVHAGVCFTCEASVYCVVIRELCVEFLPESKIGLKSLQEGMQQTKPKTSIIMLGTRGATFY